MWKAACSKCGHWSDYQYDERVVDDHSWLDRLDADGWHDDDGFLLCASCASTRCTVDGCVRKLRARGLCQSHWKRWRRGGDTDGRIVPRDDDGLVLPAGPLVAAVEACRRPLRDLLPSNTDRTAFYRARKTGQVSEPTADRLAIRALGWTLWEIYDAEMLA